MARILFTTWPFQGHLHPLLTIAAHLRARGHECAFFSGAGAQNVVTAEGHRFFPFRSIPINRVYSVLMANEAGNHHWYRIPSLVRSLQTIFIDTLPQQLDDLDPVVEEWKPDVIGCDLVFWGPMLAYGERLPVAICSSFPACTIPGEGIPRFGLGMAPPRNAWQRAVCGAMNVVWETMGRPVRERMNQIRRGRGLPDLPGPFHALQSSLPLHLVPCSREFDYGRTNVPANVRYIGPCLWSPARSESNQAFIDAIPSGRPWIYATEGTLHSGKPVLLSAAAEGLKSFDAEVIMTTGTDRDPSAMGMPSFGPNMHVTRWLAHGEFFPRLHLVITTGGAGVVLWAMAHGIPTIVVPTAWDKPENAQRVVEAGAGLRIAPWDCTRQSLRAAVERVLGDARFRQGAQRIRDSFGALGGPARAADLLEGLSSK